MSEHSSLQKDAIDNQLVGKIINTNYRFLNKAQKNSDPREGLLNKKQEKWMAPEQHTLSF